MNWRGWFDVWHKPDPLREALRQNREETERLCDKMAEFEQTVIRYHGRPPRNYGRRCDDDTLPNGAQQ